MASKRYIVVSFENYGWLVYDSKLNEVICKCPFHVYAQDIASSMNHHTTKQVSARKEQA